MVPEFGTGIMLLKKTAVDCEARIEKFVYDSYGGRHKWVEGVVYLRQGSETEWDYVQIPVYGSPRFFRHQPDIEVDEKGKVITKK